MTKRQRYMLAYRVANREKLRAYEKARANDAKRLAGREAYRKTAGGRAAFARARKRWAQANREKRAAQSAVANALKYGRLTRQRCERCSNRRVDAHHDNYAKPLKVRWLCRKHHFAVHREQKERSK